MKPKLANAKKYMNFRDLLNKLKSILLSKYLMKGNLQISPGDMIQIQSTDEHL